MWYRLVLSEITKDIKIYIIGNYSSFLNFERMCSPSRQSYLEVLKKSLNWFFTTLFTLKFPQKYGLFHLLFSHKLQTISKSSSSLYSSYFLLHSLFTSSFYFQFCSPKSKHAFFYSRHYIPITFIILFFPAHPWVLVSIHPSQ